VNKNKGKGKDPGLWSGPWGHVRNSLSRWIYCRGLISLISSAQAKEVMVLSILLKADYAGSDVPDVKQQLLGTLWGAAAWETKEMPQSSGSVSDSSSPHRTHTSCSSLCVWLSMYRWSYWFCWRCASLKTDPKYTAISTVAIKSIQPPLHIRFIGKISEEEM